MKKILFIVTILLVTITLTSKAQIQRGNVLVGGDISKFNFSLNSGGNFSMNISPKLGFFIRDNVALGGYVDLGLSTAKAAGTNINYGVGALGRYYINDNDINLLRHGRFFIEGTAGIEGNNPAVGDNTNGLGLGVGPGYAYFITPNIGLEGLLKYNGIVGFGSKPTSSSLDLGIGFQIYLSSSKAKSALENQQ